MAHILHSPSLPNVPGKHGITNLATASHSVAPSSKDCVPLPQGRHFPGPDSALNVIGGQSIHPEAAYIEPAGQLVSTQSLALSEPCGDLLPTSQSVHAVAPPKPYLPAGQGLHIPPAFVVPAGQPEHDVDPAKLANSPDGHLVQLVCDSLSL